MCIRDRGTGAMVRTGVHCSDSAPTASPAQAITTPTSILYLYVNHILRISILITCLLYTSRCV